jgi:hypothetical protein
MAYSKLPNNQVVSANDFVKQMNEVLFEDGYASEGYQVVSDTSGYWLEKNGVKIEGIEASTILNSTKLKTGIY